MKTNLARTIENASDAEMYLKELYNNNEAYHPDDDEINIVWDCAQPNGCDILHLNNLMHQVCSIDNFDPYGYLLLLHEQ